MHGQVEKTGSFPEADSFWFEPRPRTVTVGEHHGLLVNAEARCSGGLQFESRAWQIIFFNK